MMPIRTILHPTDFSERADNAFGLACALARDYRAKLILLHVAVQPTIVYPDGLLPIQPAVQVKELKEKLDQVQPSSPEICVERQLIEGDPVTGILNVAKEAACDLIVMGTHGWTGLNRLLMGSVAEQVMRKAACPVLTVKTPIPQLQPAKESRKPGIRKTRKTTAKTAKS